MAKYRKKPVVVEAIQVTSENLYEEAREFAGDAFIFGRYDKCYIQTLEGKMEFYPGDYIIKGIEGEFYPCREDIFEATYEKVNDDG